MAAAQDAPRGSECLVERREDCELLGWCWLKRINYPGAPNPGDMEIGWRFRESAWGQGIAKEAAIASLDLAFGRFAAPFALWWGLGRD